MVCGDFDRGGSFDQNAGRLRRPSFVIALQFLTGRLLVKEMPLHPQQWQQAMTCTVPIPLRRADFRRSAWLANLRVY